MSENEKSQDVQPVNETPEELSEDQLDNVAGGAIYMDKLAAPENNTEIGLLLPAIQAAREAARRG